MTIWSSSDNKGLSSAFDYCMPKKMWALGAVTANLYDTMKSAVYEITSNPLSIEIEVCTLSSLLDYFENNVFCVLLKQDDGAELLKGENGNHLVNELGTTENDVKLKSIHLIVLHAASESNFQNFCLKTMFFVCF